MKKKILAALSALTLGATMMGGTAMSASAITVTNNGGDGGFWAYYYGTDDGTTYTTGWHKAPYGMYDNNIVSAVDNGNNTVTLTLQATTYEITNPAGVVVRIIEGAEITGIYTVDDEECENNLITVVSGVNTVTLTKGVEYTYDANDHHSTDTLKFVIS